MPADLVEQTLSEGTKKPDIKHGGYIFACQDIKVCVSKEGIIKTVFTKETNGLRFGLEDQLERWMIANGS